MFTTSASFIRKLPLRSGRASAEGDHQAIVLRLESYSRRGRRRRRSDSPRLRGPTLRDASHFRSVLSNPDRSVLADFSGGGASPSSRENLARYNVDWTGRHRGSSPLVLRPASASEVRSVLLYCHSNRIGVVPQGGNTGLCGGATPMGDEVLLSMERMDRIRGLDGLSGVLTCDAGCTLQSLHDYARERGQLFPLDIGSKGTCQIGGNVSTNAGGQYFSRFGGLHGTVVGLEAVLPDGRVLRLNMGGAAEGNAGRGGSGTRSGTHLKDNTGYDLKHLFIGAEGTLGVVTKVAVACPALPTSKNAALLVCNSYDDVLAALQAAKEELGEVLSAMELMDHNTLQFVQEHGGFGGDDGGSTLLRDMLRTDPTERRPPLFLLVETQGSDPEHDASKMDSFLSRLHDSGSVKNGFLAQDSRQVAEMWGIRESCNPSVARAGHVYKFDVSIPIKEYMDVAGDVKEELSAAATASDLTVCVWGHVADGNAHINVVAPGGREEDPALAGLVEAAVFRPVLSRGGSISAEHGLGQTKNELLGRIKEDVVLDVMAGVKLLFDPRGIMNPGKYLPRNVVPGGG